MSNEIYGEWPDEDVVAYFADGHCERIIDQTRVEELMR